MAEEKKLDLGAMTLADDALEGVSGGHGSEPVEIIRLWCDKCGGDIGTAATEEEADRMVERHWFETNQTHYTIKY